MEPHRPFGLTLLSLLNFFSGLTFLALGADFALHPSAFPPEGTVTVLAGGGIACAVAVVTWTRRRGGVQANNILSIVTIISMLYWILESSGLAVGVVSLIWNFTPFLFLCLLVLGYPGVFAGLALEAWVVVYLRTPKVRDYFRGAATQPEPMGAETKT